MTNYELKKKGIDKKQFIKIIILGIIIGFSSSMIIQRILDLKPSEIRPMEKEHDWMVTFSTYEKIGTSGIGIGEGSAKYDKERNQILLNGELIDFDLFKQTVDLYTIIDCNEPQYAC